MIKPFGFHLLPRLRRSHLAWMRQLQSHLGPEAPAAFQRWASRLLTLNDTSSSTFLLQVKPLTMASSPEAKQILSTGAATLSLRGPDRLRTFLILDSKLAGTLVGLLLNTAPLPLVSPITEGMYGLITYALANLLYELGPTCAWSLEQDPQPNIDETPLWFILESQLQLGNITALAWVLVEETIFRRLPPSETKPWTGARLGRLRGIQINLPVIIGRFTLSLNDLTLLGKGDVILFPDCPRKSEPFVATVRVGNGGFPVTVKGSQAILNAPYGGEIKEMSSPEKDIRVLAEELPVELVIELGRLRLTAAQVLSLAPGDVLTLDRPLADWVDIRAGDRRIARGELVEVDGETGVRLMEVFDEG